MSSSTSQPPEKLNPMAAKLLDRARSINIRPDPEDAAIAHAAAQAPVQRTVVQAAESPAVTSDAPVVPQPAPEARTESRPRRKADKVEPARADAGRTFNRTFDIVTGPSTRALTVRIPDEVHARLVLVATSNRLGRTGEASTLNELIAEGIEHVLRRYDAA